MKPKRSTLRLRVPGPARRPGRASLMYGLCVGGVPVRHGGNDPLLADLFARKLDHRTPFPQNEHAIRTLCDLLEFGGYLQARKSAIRERANETLNLGLGADVDATCRLVKDKDLRVHCEPARQQDFLLVAA